MRQIVFSAQARRDVHDAWAYIATDNVNAADDLCDRIHRAVQLLADFPGIGHHRADVPGSRHRFWLVRPYLLAY